ncbi:unnamed protein product [Linum trigynum]|uniref:Uncharacterized protein n=1 Tax=Linum trigynum TaxID=586398 RepID=A0AAV2ELR5_9ROSI
MTVIPTCPSINTATSEPGSYDAWLEKYNARQAFIMARLSATGNQLREMENLLWERNHGMVDPSTLSLVESAGVRDPFSPPPGECHRDRGFLPPHVRRNVTP